MDNKILEAVIDGLKNDCQKNNRSFASGSDAVEAMKSAGAKDPERTSGFQINDLVVIPSLDSANWAARTFGTSTKLTSFAVTYITRKGKDIQTNVFLGSLIKSASGQHSSILVKKTKSAKTKVDIYDDLVGCASAYEQWEMLAGKTLKVKALEEVKTQRRDYDTGQMRDVTVLIPTFEEA